MADLPGGVNPLDFLYKLSLQRGLPPPAFSQLYEEGPPHLKVFVWSCAFNGLDAKGTGRSKKEAKVAAATELKRNLNLDALPPVVEKKKRPNTGKSDLQPNQNARKKVKKEGRVPSQTNTGPGPTGNHFASVPAVTFETFRGSFLYDPKFAEDGLDVLPAPHFPGNVFSSRISKMDRFMFLKTYEIRPTDVELALMRRLVEITETAFTEVVNEFNAGDDKVFEARFRVGDLFKVTMLRGTRQVELVLMCYAVPTRSLVQDLLDKVGAKLAEKDLDKKYKIDMAEDRTSLRTSLTEGDDTFFCNVLLTSRKARHRPVVEDGNTTESHPDEIPKDILLNALAEHRHARWVHVASRSTPGYLDTVRIMKEIQLRDPVWATMSHWAMEVLVERALNTASLPPNPAACVMRVMEVIACGFLYNTGVGLRDPCEYGNVDVLNNMSELDRDALTAKAQMQLRMMHFRKTDIVLDLHSVGDSDVRWHPGGNKRPQVGAKTEPIQDEKDKQNGNGVSVG